MTDSEALRRLIAEGALVHQGNRRVSVQYWTLEGIQELEFNEGKSLRPNWRKARRRPPCQRPFFKRTLSVVDDLLEQPPLTGGDIGDY